MIIRVVISQLETLNVVYQQQRDYSTPGTSPRPTAYM